MKTSEPLLQRIASAFPPTVADGPRYRHTYPHIGRIGATLLSRRKSLGKKVVIVRLARNRLVVADWMGQCCSSRGDADWMGQYCSSRIQYQCARSLLPSRWNCPLERRRLGQMPRWGGECPDAAHSPLRRRTLCRPRSPARIRAGREIKYGLRHPQCPQNGYYRFVHQRGRAIPSCCCCGGGSTALP